MEMAIVSSELALILVLLLVMAGSAGSFWAHAIGWSVTLSGIFIFRILLAGIKNRQIFEK